MGGESAGSYECLYPVRIVLEITASYPEGHKFKTNLEGAVPRPFIFLRYPGVPPTTAAPSCRYATPLSCTGTCATSCPRRRGGGVFSVLVSVARTCRRLGIFPRTAVENLVRDPDWRLPKLPPGQERQYLVAPVAAAC